jgi:transcriptional regulator with XRE-family HTH domain
MEKKEMGKKLQQLRKECGMSQFQLAVASGVPVSTLQGWEQGRREPLLLAAARVAKALGVSLDQLAGLMTEQETRGAPEPPRRRRHKGE